MEDGTKQIPGGHETEDQTEKNGESNDLVDIGVLATAAEGLGQHEVGDGDVNDDVAEGVDAQVDGSRSLLKLEAEFVPLPWERNSTAPTIVYDREVSE